MYLFDEAHAITKSTVVYYTVKPRYLELESVSLGFAFLVMNYSESAISNSLLSRTVFHFS